MAGMTLAQFNATLRKFTKRMSTEELVGFQKKIVLTFLEGVVYETPVDQGRAMGNWQVTIDNPAEGEVEGASGRTEDQVTFDGLAALGGLVPFQIVWVTNNVPYIMRLNEGWSPQAPPGFIEDNLQRAAEQVGV